MYFKLLKEGYSVKTTFRSLNRQDEVKEMLRVGGINTFENLSFIEADLSNDKNWDEAVKGCEFVLHVASPTPAIQFTHEDELINPAKDGVLRVLRASRDANVKRVVLTSAFGAVGFQVCNIFSGNNLSGCNSQIEIDMCIHAQK
ncbi:NAD(P)H-binding protein [Flavobacterium sp. ASV13]|uniref:NAD(P)H-binding protein n=1 Tax=Flavobacterium sp. ASV13 TaxID=1506583 RepID=UPI00068DE444